MFLRADEERPVVHGIRSESAFPQRILRQFLEGGAGFDDHANAFLVLKINPPVRVVFPEAARFSGLKSYVLANAQR